MLSYRLLPNLSRALNLWMGRILLVEKEDILIFFPPFVDSETEVPIPIMEKPRLGEGEDRQGPPSAQPSQRENSAVQRLLLWPKELSLVTPVNTTLDKLSPQKSTTAAAAGEAEAGEGETGPKTKFPPSPGMIKASFVDMTISRGNRPLFRCFTMRPLAGREQDTKKPVLRGKVIGYRRLDTDVGEEQYLVHWDGGKRRFIFWTFL